MPSPHKKKTLAKQPDKANLLLCDGHNGPVSVSAVVVGPREPQGRAALHPVNAREEGQLPEADDISPGITLGWARVCQQLP